jgi:hypothetical protein
MKVITESSLWPLTRAFSVNLNLSNSNGSTTVTTSNLQTKKDAILGNHATDDDGNPIDRTVINGNEKLERPTFICAAMPRFVKTRGGDYFFIPSLTALRMIGEGIIDPT